MTRRRILLAVVAVALVVSGLTLARLTDGAGWTFVGDALYAALLYVVVAAIAPQAAARTASVLAFAACAAIEVFQLSGIPARLAQALPVAALVLGTTFQWTDLLAYALGAAAAGVVDAVSRRATGSSRGAPTTPSAGGRRMRPRAGTPSR